MTREDKDAPLMLSVSGVRGIVGRSMTPMVAMQFAAAYGTHLREQVQRDAPRAGATTIVLGRDTRPSGVMLADAVRAGLLAVGCDVIDLGVAMTPTVGVMVQHRHAAGGMVVTASHNPLPWNGLKCLDAHGAAPPAAQARTIIERYRAGAVDLVDAAHAFAAHPDGAANQVHIDRVLGVVDAGAIRRATLRVVLDSVNGAGCAPGRMLLEQLGCEVIHLNGEPTGRFAHTPEPTEVNLEQLSRVTAAESADIGFAQDPDGDRLAIVDERGHYIGEEYTLVLAAMQWLQHTSTRQHVNTPEKVPGIASRENVCLAANLSTSRMIDDLAARYGATVIRTPVGEGNVVAGMKQHQAIIGGEGNGGVIVPQVCWVRDSLGAIALVLGLLAVGATKRRSEEAITTSSGAVTKPRNALSPGRSTPLSSIVSSLPQYVMIKHTFDLQALGGAEAIEPALAKAAKRFADARPNTCDGVRIDFPANDAGEHSGPSGSWVHLRPSNTEPIIRLIAEAPTRERAWELIDEVAVAAGLK